MVGEECLGGLVGVVLLRIRKSDDIGPNTVDNVVSRRHIFQSRKRAHSAAGSRTPKRSKGHVGRTEIAMVVEFQRWLSAQGKIASSPRGAGHLSSLACSLPVLLHFRRPGMVVLKSQKTAGKTSVG